MPINNNDDPNLHSCKMMLYEHHFENLEGAGKYIARPANERTLGEGDLVSDMRTIDGCMHSREIILDVLGSFKRVKMFRMLDGFRVSDGQTVSYIQLTGTFNGPNEPANNEKTRAVIRNVSTREAREYAKRVKPEIAGIAHVSGEIFSLHDTEEPDALRNMYLPDNVVLISGEKIKVEGDHPDCGVYFAPEDGLEKPVKMEHLALNKAAQIIGRAPLAGSRFCRIRIVTQYTGGKPLKEPRVITSGFVIEAL